MVKEFFSNKNGDVVIAQRPNSPLIAWIAMTLIARFTSGDIARYASILSTGAVLIWAGLEIVYGASLFRRFLGSFVAVMVIYGALS